MALRNIHLVFLLAFLVCAALSFAAPTARPKNLNARPDRSVVAEGERLEAANDEDDVDRSGYYGGYSGKGYGYYDNYGYGKGYGKGYGYYDNNYGYGNGYGKGYGKRSYGKGYGYYY